ncbi:MAG TPA: tetratricopeptide repeat protein [Nitrospinota bacterium]|nr:tetratricopeptide repeat protein [Nitrospinota bacterium]
METNQAEKAKTILENLIKSKFILSDYAIYDLAVLEFKAKRYLAALSTIALLEAKYPESPTLLDALKLKTELSCNDLRSSLCGKMLETTSSKLFGAEFLAKREYLYANRAIEMDSPITAYKHLQNIYYNKPTSSVADVAKRGTIKLRKEYPKKIVNAFPHATFSQRISRVNRLNGAYRFDDAVDDLNRMLNIGYSKKRKAKILYTLGITLKRARRSSEAITVLNKLKLEHPKSDLTHYGLYQLAVIEWNNNRDHQAQKVLLKVLETTNDNDLIKKCLFVLGKIEEANGNFSRAIKLYDSGLKITSSKQLEERFRWQLAWTTYIQGNYKRASALFVESLVKQRPEKRDGGAIYWKIRSYKKMNKQTEVAAKDLRTVFPHTYYGLRIDSGPINRIKTLIEPANKKEIRGVAERSYDGKLTKRTKLHLLRYQLLLLAGMEKRAVLEVNLIKKSFHKLDVKKAIWLGTLYLKAGDPWSCLLLQSNIASKIKQKDDFNSPFWRMYYPIAYWAEVSNLSKRFSVDPFLTLSIIRQESAFNDKAHSPANARGLMQLIPSTGKTMFGKLGNEQKFNNDILFNHSINLTLGIAHLAELIEEFNGNIILTVAAYNAGSSVVKKWAKRIPMTPDDEFIELLPYPETRGYVKKVLRNWMMYKILYSNNSKNYVNKDKVKYLE